MNKDVNANGNDVDEPDDKVCSKRSPRELCATAWKTPSPVCIERCYYAHS